MAQKQGGKLPWEERLDEATMGRLLDERLSTPGVQQRRLVLDATAVAAYHATVGFPVVKLLVCDDAPQLTWLTEGLAVCWVQVARLYKKLVPTYPPFQNTWAEYLDPFWDYYDELLAYRENPTPAKAERLSTRFGALFSVTTDYYALDNRIGKTKAKKAARLKVLAHPEIPLHIDAAELGARQRVCKRDVSFCPQTADGGRE